MAYATKYKVTFKDHYNYTVECEIQEDGFSGSATNLTPTDDPLTITWPGERDDIFNPVRGSMATLRFYNESTSMFDEFFEASATTYKLVISKDAAVKWTGWLTLEDYQEALLYPPYIVQINAYDLGFLQNIYWDNQYVSDDTIKDVIFRILDAAGLGIELVETVNIAEDSISDPDTTTSMLDLINVHAAAFIEDSWESVTMYEALRRILLSFGAFIVQDNGYWNIGRVAELRHSHYYRIYDSSGTYSTGGTQDYRSDLSSYDQIDRTALMMSCPVFRKLNMKQIPLHRNLVNNGTVGDVTADPYDYWSYDGGGESPLYYKSRTYSGITTLTDTPVLEIDHTAAIGTRTYIEHNIEYKVYTGMAFELSYFWETSGTSVTNVPQIQIRITSSGTDYWMNMTDGTWETSTTDSDLIDSGETTTLPAVNIPFVGSDAVLSIRIAEAVFATTGKTFISMDLKLNFISTDPSVTRNYEYKDYDLEINANNLEESSDIEFYFGDTIDISNPKTEDVLLGHLTVAADGTSTGGWTNGSIPLLDVIRNNYRDQYGTPSRRLQCTLKGDLNYLTILRDSSGRCYLASSITRDFRRSELQGEWIEIKANRLLADIVACWELDETSGTTVTDALGSNNGTNSGATVNQSGKVGTAYDFNGTSDYISFPYSDFEFNPLTESYTISIWVNSTNPSPTADVVYLINMWSGVGGDVRPFVFNIVPSSSDLVSMVMYDGSTSLSADIAGASVWDGEWHLLSMVVDHSSGEFYSYLDGVLQDTTEITFPGWTPISTPYFYISSIGSATPARFYDGLADQITVHNRALEAIELINLARGVPYDEFGI